MVSARAAARGYLRPMSRLLPFFLVPLVACSDPEVTSSSDDGSAADDWSGTDGGDGSEGSDEDDDIDVPELGSPVDPPVAGTAWRVWFSEMEVSDPPGGAALLDTMLDEDSLIFYVDWTGSESFGMLVAVGVDGLQDICEVPQELPRADFSENPLFTIEDVDLVIDPSGTGVTARNATLMGILDGTGWSWGALRASLDSRDFQEDLDAIGLDACEMLEDLGSSCVPCDDGVETCMELVIDDLVAEPYPGTFDPNAGDAC